MIGLEPNNIIRGLHVLQEIGYGMSIPVTPEQFADPAQRETWRRDKNMLVLRLASDQHRRTPIDVFVYEPFDFAREYDLAQKHIIYGEETAPVISYGALLKMKTEAGRDKDLLDLQQLRKLDPHR